MTTYDLLLRRVAIATMRDDAGYGLVERGAIGIRDGRIAWLGRDADLPRDATAARTLSLEGHLATPGLVDCHTHLVYAGSRANEFEQRLEGASYADIARQGGGIRATVRATRAATEAQLLADASTRAAALRAEGVTTVEVKSGYGLATEPELKQLRVARALGDASRVSVRTTLLAAHAVPPEFDNADDYVDYVCRDTIPAAARAGLADAVDAFCESIAFSAAQTARVFEAARAHGLPVKLHADQLGDGGGAALAARHHALSADHLEHASEAGIAAMRAAGTVAVLLPGAWYALRETHAPPLAALRAAGVPMALATDSNPGTSPTTSPTLVMNLACTLFRMTPAEALGGFTRHAARALGLPDRGRLDAGLRADVAVWPFAAPAELAYRMGSARCAARVVAGVLDESSLPPLAATPAHVPHAAA
jgi:imidazolonepropionase